MRLPSIGISQDSLTFWLVHSFTSAYTYAHFWSNAQTKSVKLMDLNSVCLSHSYHAYSFEP